MKHSLRFYSLLGLSSLLLSLGCSRVEKEPEPLLLPDAGGVCLCEEVPGSTEDTPWEERWIRPFCGIPQECYTPQDSVLIARYPQQKLCLHELPKPDCEDGWCKIPAGTATLGPRQDAFYLHASGHEITQVSFDHDIIVMQHELTRAEWRQLIKLDPSHIVKDEHPTIGNPNSPLFAGTCEADDCPVGNINYFGALHYANLKSIAEGLEPCFELRACEGEAGASLNCQEVLYRYKSIYDCPGYRPPTAGETERFTRAGSRTDTYAGNAKSPGSSGPCLHREKALEEIAWYAYNSGDGIAHPVGTKLPNAFGLFDTIGNVSEYTTDGDNGSSYIGRELNPETPARHYPGFRYPTGDAPMKSAGAAVSNITLSMASVMLAAFYPGENVPFLGLRLVRTTSWPNGKIPEPFLHHGDGTGPLP